MPDALTLRSYRLMGRSGLRVSLLCLGAMTFGTDWGWGSDQSMSRRIFDTYVDRGGNFIDTANQYTNGTSETMLGKFIVGQRQNLVIATKYSVAMRPGDPNSGGNHRKNMMQSIDESLKRLDTDYIDLFYLHAWDFTTSVEEILRGLDDLVSRGKVLYVGMSNVPAWQISRMQAIADLRGWSPLVALQLAYNLIDRSAERDLIPMARAMGLGVQVWSPLAMGVLTGKFDRSDLTAASSDDVGGTRRNVAMQSGLLNAKGLSVADVVVEIAKDAGHTPAQIALAWLLQNPGVTAPILGASSLDQLEENLSALELRLTTEQCVRLDEVSAIEFGYPHEILKSDQVLNAIFGGVDRLRRL